MARYPHRPTCGVTFATCVLMLFAATLPMAAQAAPTKCLCVETLPSNGPGFRYGTCPVPSGAGRGGGFTRLATACNQCDTHLKDISGDVASFKTITEDYLGARLQLARAKICDETTITVLNVVITAGEVFQFYKPFAAVVKKIVAASKKLRTALQKEVNQLIKPVLAKMDKLKKGVEQVDGAFATTINAIARMRNFLGAASSSDVPKEFGRELGVCSAFAALDVVTAGGAYESNSVRFPIKWPTGQARSWFHGDGLVPKATRACARESIDVFAGLVASFGLEAHTPFNLGLSLANAVTGYTEERKIVQVAKLGMGWFHAGMRRYRQNVCTDRYTPSFWIDAIRLVASALKPFVDAMETELCVPPVQVCVPDPVCVTLELAKMVPGGKVAVAVAEKTGLAPAARYVSACFGLCRRLRDAGSERQRSRLLVSVRKVDLKALKLPLMVSLYLMIKKIMDEANTVDDPTDPSGVLPTTTLSTHLQLLTAKWPELPATLAPLVRDLKRLCNEDAGFGKYKHPRFCAGIAGIATPLGGGRRLGLEDCPQRCNPQICGTVKKVLEFATGFLAPLLDLAEGLVEPLLKPIKDAIPDIVPDIPALALPLSLPDVPLQAFSSVNVLLFSKLGKLPVSLPTMGTSLHSPRGPSASAIVNLAATDTCKLESGLTLSNPGNCATALQQCGVTGALSSKGADEDDYCGGDCGGQPGCLMQLGGVTVKGCNKCPTTSNKALVKAQEAAWEAKAVAAQVKSCPSGQEPTDDKNACRWCPSKTWKRGTNLERCVAEVEACPPGQQAEEQQTVCRPCAQGQFKAGTNVNDVCQPQVASCPQGEQPVADLTACAACPSGRWKAGTNLVACLSEVASCPEGKEPQDEQTVCRECTSGQFKAGTNLDVCQPRVASCPPGEQPVDDQTVCAACLLGQWKAGTNLEVCVAEVASCPEGQEPHDAQTVCRGCTSGQFKSGSNLDVCRPQVTSCPPDTEPARLNTICQRCLPGTGKSGRNMRACNRRVDACGPGQEPTEDRAFCRECPSGKESSSTSLELCQCKAITNGKEFISWLDVARCGSCGCARSTKPLVPSCPPGTEPWADQTECRSCFAGRFKAGTNLQVCETCAPPRTTDAGQTTCSSGGQGGQQLPTPSALVLVPSCPEDHQPEGDQTVCVPCSAGTWKRGANLDICQPVTLVASCGENLEPFLEQKICRPCAPLTYKEGNNLDICKARGLVPSCGPGFQPEDDQTICRSCPEGKYKAGTNLEICQFCSGTTDAGRATCARKLVPSCPPGQEPWADQTTCRLCAAGRYQATTSLDICLPCSGANKTTTDGVTCIECAGNAGGGAANLVPWCRRNQEPFCDQTICRQCPPLTYKAGKNLNICAARDLVLRCAPGFQPEDDQTFCKVCPAGTFKSTADLQICVPCAGTTDVDRTACTVCASTAGGPLVQSCGENEEPFCDQSICRRCAPLTYKEGNNLDICKARGLVPIPAPTEPVGTKKPDYTGAIVGVVLGSIAIVVLSLLYVRHLHTKKWEHDYMGDKKKTKVAKDTEEDGVEMMDNSEMVLQGNLVGIVT